MKLNTKRNTQTSALPSYVGLVRWAFTRFYREFAWTYDGVAALVSGGQWSRWTLAALPYLRGDVLELGFGTGNLQRAMAGRAGQPPAFGLDASAQMVALARAKVERAGGTARLVRGDARDLPFSPRSLDTVVATFPSEYIADTRTLTEIRRVLRPDGQLLIILGAQFAESSLYRQAIDLLYRVTLQRPIIATPAEPEPEPPSLLAERMAAAGFTTSERWEPYGTSGVRLHLLTGAP